MVAYSALDRLERSSTNEDLLSFSAYATRLADEWFILNRCVLRCISRHRLRS